MTQFGLGSDFKMTPQEVNRVANLQKWTTVLEVMIKSRQADLAFQTMKQERWNQQAQDRQAHQDFLEEHRGTGKFSGKYAPQPQQWNSLVFSYLASMSGVVCVVCSFADDEKLKNIHVDLALLV